jgi:hypothetical protein
MRNVVSFGEVLEAADRLPGEEQEMLLQILRQRLLERRREELRRDVRSALNEFKEGRGQPATPDELMSEILS